MIRRNTVQKELILNTVHEMRSHVTAEEVYEYIHEAYPNISKGTVYRDLAALADEGKIRKVEIPDGPDRYDFTIINHYHVRCVKCGNVSDVDMDTINDMNGRIKDTHGIKFIDYDILFKGICPSCQKTI